MSLAFPNLDVLSVVIHRAPWAGGWLREDAAYEKLKLTPRDVVRFYYARRLLAWRESPADVVWLRPVEVDATAGWAALADEARERST